MVAKRAFNYARPIGESVCGHALEAHVVHDRVTATYRVELRCRCGHRRFAPRSAWAAYRNAEVAAAKLLAKRMEVKQ